MEALKNEDQTPKRNVSQKSIDKAKNELPLIHKLAIAAKEQRDTKEWVGSTKIAMEASAEFIAHRNAKVAYKEASEDVEALLMEAEEEFSKSQIKIQFRNEK